MEYQLTVEDVYPEGGRKQLLMHIAHQKTNILTMVYDVLLHTARLESNGDRRLFMVYQQGKRHPKIIFKNEYGFDAGIIETTNTGGEFGSLSFFEVTYFYNLSYKDDGFLAVYKNTNEKPLISFTMEVSATTTLGNFASNRLPEDYFYCLLMGICWYLQLPVKAANYFTPDFNVPHTQTVYH